MTSYHCVVMTTSFHCGGAEAVTEQLFCALAAKGHRVEWCALYEPGEFGEIIAARHHSLRSEFMRNRKDWRGFIKLVLWLRQVKPDVVWFICQPATVFWAQLAARLVGARCVAAIHNTIVPDSLGKWHPYRWLLSHVDRVVFVGETQRRILLNGLLLKPSATAVIYNGIDISGNADCDRHTIRRELGFSDRDIVVCNVSRLYPVKGVDISIQAAALCCRMIPELKFVLIGNGPEHEELHRLIETLQLADCVKLLGLRDDVERLLPAFDIGMLSSRSEALPISLLEYMKAGLPMIATEVGSVKEIVSPESNGLLVPPENPQQLAEAILRLAREPQTRAAWGKAGRQHLLERFSLERMVSTTEQLLADLCEKR